MKKIEQECKFLKQNKFCDALACFNGRKCKAKDKNGTPRYLDNLKSK